MDANYFRTWTIDDLLKRDEQREKDGLKRRIRIGRIASPSPGKGGKVILVPVTNEEKFWHDPRSQYGQGQAGTGPGEEGDVIGEQPLHEESEGGQGGAGQGEGGEHGIEESAYEVGRTITEKFQLPNLKAKGGKQIVTVNAYDLTDIHVGAGQLLDKKATLRRIISSNLGLGIISDPEDIDPAKLIVSPNDQVFRIVSLEKVPLPQALVFFLRDYSGSMQGRPTEIVVGQHVLIYSWLMFQYNRQVETRFILHDTEAKEVDNFHVYYHSTVAGGTRVASAFNLVNQIVTTENLAKDFNIYVFHGTDGDDWDNDGKEVIPEIERTMSFASRIGITIAGGDAHTAKFSVFGTVLEKSGLLERKSLIRLDKIPLDADENRFFGGIRNLVS